MKAFLKEDWLQFVPELPVKNKVLPSVKCQRKHARVLPL